MESSDHKKRTRKRKRKRKRKREEKENLKMPAQLVRSHILIRCLSHSVPLYITIIATWSVILVCLFGIVWRREEHQKRSTTSIYREKFRERDLDYDR